MGKVSLSMPYNKRGERRNTQKRDYIRTPTGYMPTEEERREMQKNIPRGRYPGAASKGHVGVKFNYYRQDGDLSSDSYPQRAIQSEKEAKKASPVKRRSPLRYTRKFTSRLITNIPKGSNEAVKQRYWERELLGAYFHIYDESWNQWPLIIPWLCQNQLRERAIEYGCELPWDWMRRQEFIIRNDFSWNMRQLKRLIDWYPESQEDDSKEGIYIDGKSFLEVMEVAKALNLPTKEVLSMLAMHARMLDVR